MSDAITDRFAKARVAVIGDLMLDVYLDGVIERISPEAPVPVVRARDQRHVPGGAANVAANVLAFGAQVDIVGVIGSDGRDLIDVLAARGYDDQGGLVVDSSRRTIRKQRIMAGQQVVRIDFEDLHPLSAVIEQDLVTRATAAIAKADVVVLSDYGKGVLTDTLLAAVIAHAKALDKPVIVDPKRRNLAGYCGATIITPNRGELVAATGLSCETDHEAQAAISSVQAVCGSAVLLTRSEKGMSYYPMSGEVLHFPARALEVFDVSGAGDTVVAALAVMLACDEPIETAIRFANDAAGVVVGKAGTATVTFDEVIEAKAKAEGHLSIDGALVSRAEAIETCRRWTAQGLTIGFANGCFDLIHPGHISLIHQASGACDRLVVALNTDASVQRLKGSNRPVQNEVARAQVIGSIKGVDLVTLFDEDTPLELITALQPDLLVKGADYTVDTVVGADQVLARDGRVLLADLTPGQSSSRLISRMTAPTADG
ncbi:MAG: D-glycero-beta-D-manno-heptose-7-phosphate kinase [Novosphingobium sp.]|uniref:D-glycero-beta-D-manno-heptose-7-phosphate kinase n=1 Tax=Novosphingobium sp. TaxID=1874826 RepID=UPI00273293C7|nr:D-glycero-beta-D-manno-heptose-7-phosphate kinase [Novosphingobium sp.]MDP3549104.1 D-glycero-beta-D-manno-heptose-7-phosphate kinase [Novosphingobium sp.]